METLNTEHILNTIIIRERNITHQNNKLEEK